MTTPDAAAATVTPQPTRLACGAPGCPATGIIQWRRRLTGDEFAAFVATEESRRAQVLLLADPQLPAPVFGPLPVQGDCVRAVYSCGPHSITVDAGSQVHQAACTAPDPAHVPGCSCTPEPLPVSTPQQDPTVTLATGWTVPAPPAA